MVDSSESGRVCGERLPRGFRVTRGLFWARVVGGKRTFTGFIRDVTQQHEIEARLATLQTELLQLSRLSALGQMGSQLAHELNQPLGAIANFLEASRQVAAATADPVAARARGLVEKALEQVARAGAIVKRMRGFCR